MASNPPLTMSLADLRTAAKQRADMEGSPFMSDAEWNANINSSYARLYNRLVGAYGEDWFVKDPPYSFTTDGTSESFALPTDFYKLLRVEVQSSGVTSGWIPIRTTSEQEASRYTSPIVPAGLTVRVHYVPRLTPLVNDTDVVDGVSGWLDLVTIDAAIKALRKQQLDTSELKQDFDDLSREIEDAARNRDLGQPATVADNRRARWPYLPTNTLNLRYRLRANSLLLVAPEAPFVVWDGLE